MRNSFTEATRELYRDNQICVLCDQQATDLHHIKSRVSNSPLNCSPLCRECHSKMKHNNEEELTLFLFNLAYLDTVGYNINNDDINFIKQNNWEDYYYNFTGKSPTQKE